MRILAVTNLYPNPYQPDRATFNRQQLQALAVNHAVAVIAPISWTDELTARLRGAARLPKDRRVVGDRIRVEHPRYVYPPRMLRSWYGHFFRRSVRASFARALQEFRPDLVLGSWAYPDGWAAVDLGHRAGLPVVIKVHGCDILGGGTGLQRYPGRYQGTVDALRGADGIIAVSQHLADCVIQFGVDAERVRVIHNGVDAELFHPQSRETARARLRLDCQHPILLFVGNLEAVKGLDTLIDACGRLKREGIMFRGYLIGQGSLRATLERRISQEAIYEHLQFVGPVAHGQLPDWYRAANVFALPSRSEGVPNVLLEAAACGIPFVASRVGGIPEIAHVGEGQMVPPGDAGALAGALRHYLATPTNGRRPATRIRSQAEVAAELAAFFETVIEKRESGTLSASGTR